MVGSGSYFTLSPRNDSTLTQHKPYYSVNDLISEVEQYFPAGFVLASFLFNVAVSPILSHRRFVNFILRILEFLLDYIKCMMPLPIWNKLLNALFLL